MKSSRTSIRVAIWAIALAFAHAPCLTASYAGERDPTSLRFQKPGQAADERRESSVDIQFRAPSDEQPVATSQAAQSDAKVSRTSRARPVSNVKPHTNSLATPPRRKEVVSTKSSEPIQTAQKTKGVRRDRQVAPAGDEWVEYPPEPMGDIPLAFDDGCACQGDCTCQDQCACGAGCAIGEPGCGICEPGCGFADPGCGCADPSCGICEPGCGFTEPGCGVTSCGSCVGLPGPDYWCFPICLPRFKDMTFWGGVHGFRGPRDFSPSPAAPSGRSDSNFGFHEGVNISGRAPLVGLLFPQLSYQLGYQGVQSRFSGTVNSADERTQQFVTAGFFRRVETGLQFGVVWDSMSDDLDLEVDYQQVRTEVSLKSPRGREIGFWTATGSSSQSIYNVTFETVDQYALFYRWNFGRGYECRLWGGGTGNNEGILGAETYAPLNDRWSLQSGFNYLITDKNAGLQGVREEAWNIGINLVWHLGCTARRGCHSPYRPLFAVADNGWMIIDNTTPYPPQSLGD